MLLHVIDISNTDWEAQAKVVDELIAELGAEETPCIRVFNKCDAFSGELPHGEGIVCISAKTGEGTSALLRQVSELLENGKKRVSLLLPYAQAGILDMLRRECAVLDSEYTEDGIQVQAVIRPELWSKVKDFIKGDSHED